MSDARGQTAPTPAEDRTAFYDTDLSSIPLMRGPEDMPQPDLGELLSAGFTSGQARNTNAERERLREAYRPILEILNEGRQRHIWRPQDHPDRAFDNPGEWAPQAEGGGGVREREEARIWAAIARMPAERRKALGLPESVDAFHDQVNARAADRVAQADAVAARNRSWLGSGARLLGGAGAGLTDPVTVATLPVGGGGRTVAQRILIEGMANAGVAAATLPITARRSAEIGQPMDAGDAALEVGGAFALGAGVQGAVIEPLGAAARRVFGHDRLTDSERGALDLIDREDESVAISPFTPGAGTEAHLARLDAAMAALNTPPSLSARARLAAGSSLGTAPAPGVAPPVAARAGAASAPARDAFKARVRVAESGGDDAARNPRSSATGRYQFTDGTWLRYHRRVVGGEMTDAQRLAQRTDGAVQERLMEALTSDNAAALARIGAPETAGNLYLMHFAGQGGAGKILRAAPDTPIERLLTADAIAANPFLKGKSAADVIEWAHARMNEAPHGGPQVRRDQFADDEAGDAEWRAAQRAVDEAEAEMRRVDEAVGSMDAADRAAQFDYDAGALAFERYPGETAIDRRSRQDFVQGYRSAHGDTEAARVLEETEAALEGMRAGQRSIESRESPTGMDWEPEDGAAQARAIENASSDSGLGVRPMDDRIYAEHRALGEKLARNVASTHMADGLDAALDPEGAQAFARGYADVRTGRELAPPAGHEAAYQDGRWQGRFDNIVEDHPELDLDEANRMLASERAAEIEGDAGDRARAAVDNAIADRQLPRFDDPFEGPGVTTVTDSLEHDIRMLAEAEPDRIVQLGDGAPQRLDDVLRDLDEDEAAIAAARACMVPAGASA